MNILYAGSQSVNMSVSVSKLRFYICVNPCNQKKKHTSKQNISLLMRGRYQNVGIAK